MATTACRCPAARLSHQLRSSFFFKPSPGFPSVVQLNPLLQRTEARTGASNQCQWLSLSSFLPLTSSSAALSAPELLEPSHERGPHGRRSSTCNLERSTKRGVDFQVRYFSTRTGAPAQGSLRFVDPRRDKLVLRGLLFHGFHGVLEAERQLGQKFLVDVDAVLDLHKAGESDDLKDSVSYADVYMRVKEIVEGPPFQLVEAVAQTIAKTLLGEFPAFYSVRIRIGKPHVAVPGVVDFLGVDIVRKRADLVQNPQADRKDKEASQPLDQWDELASK